MTKEQLIEFIDKNIPDGDLVNFRTTREHVFEIVGVDDDCCVGLWNILIEESQYNSVNAFEYAIDDALEWRDKGGLKSEIHWE